MQTGQRRRIAVLAVVVAMAVVAAACGSGSATENGAGETRTVLVDYQHDEFASAFLRYYPANVTVRPGDTVRFRQQWTGEPHSVTMGKVVDKMFEYMPILEKYESEEEARADGVPEETIRDVVQSLGRIPAMIGEDEKPYQPGAQPCFIDEEDDVPQFVDISTEEINPTAKCTGRTKPQPAFSDQALYNSGFIPYAGKDGNTFDVPLSKDLEPGTYHFYCNYHWTSMSGTVEVVAPDKAIPSQADVTREARKQILTDAKKPLQQVRAARKIKGGSKIGNLQYPLAGRQADEEYKVLINEFLPKNASAKVGEPVTWTFDGASHTVSFNVPKYFPILAVRKDGTVFRNPEAYQPVGVDVPERKDGASPDEPAPLEADGGKYDGSGGFKSSGALYPGDKYTMTFTKRGTYRYACVLHPQMVGTIEVTD